MTDPLNIVWSRPLPAGAQPSTVTVSKDAAGRWFVSLLVEDTIDALPPSGHRVGVDAGLDSLLALSTGEKIVNPKHERADRRKLAKAQRDLARKQKDSANRAKARLKLARIHARIHARIADRIRDLLHKLSTRLVRETQTIVIEDLTVANMVKNHSLARAISDAASAGLLPSTPSGFVSRAQALLAQVGSAPEQIAATVQAAEALLSEVRSVCSRPSAG